MFYTRLAPLISFGFKSVEFNFYIIPIRNGTLRFPPKEPTYKIFGHKIVEVKFIPKISLKSCPFKKT